MTALFGCLYYAALRPEEAVALRNADCPLPGSGGGGMKVVGYLDRLSATAGTDIRCMVSTQADAVDVDVVRLIHGDTSPAGPGMKTEPVTSVPARSIPGRVQNTFTGSCMVAEGLGQNPVAGTSVSAVIQPTLPEAGHDQGIAALVDAEGTPLLALVVDCDADLVVRDVARARNLCSLAIRWRRGAWYQVRVTVSLDASVHLSCRLARAGGHAAQAEETTVVAARFDSEFSGLVAGAVCCPNVNAQWQPPAPSTARLRTRASRGPMPQESPRSWQTGGSSTT